MNDFDRVRPRKPQAPPSRIGRPVPRARDGRQTLFSAGDPDAGFGAVRISCSRCHETTAVSPLKVVRLGLPSVHVPLLHRGFPSYLKCPACGRRSWVKLSLWHAPSR